MALEIRDPADSSPTTKIMLGAHSNLLSGKSHGFQIRAAFVYNLHVDKSVPPLLRERTKFWFHSESPEVGVPKMFGGHGGMRRSFGFVLH